MAERYASQHRGVYPSGNPGKPWIAQINIAGKMRHLGSFASEKDAAAAYRTAVAAAPPRRRARWRPAIRTYGLYDDRDWVEIELTKGRWAKVDTADLGLVMHNCWSYHAEYATTGVDGRTILMHRVILGLGPGHVPEVDHINHNPLDNRRSNLRVGTRNQNGWNRRKQRSPSSSRFKGVDRFHGRIWRARIRLDSKDIHIGLYEIEEEAARAYNTAATELFGEYAYLNEV